MCRCEGCKDLLTLNKENMSIVQYRRVHVDTVDVRGCGSDCELLPARITYDFQCHAKRS